MTAPYEMKCSVYSVMHAMLPLLANKDEYIFVKEFLQTHTTCFSFTCDEMMLYFEMKITLLLFRKTKHFNRTQCLQNTHTSYVFTVVHMQEWQPRWGA